MAKKTFKIGECCAGGIITVEITGQKIVIINKEWDMSKGTQRGSNQSNAKELSRISVLATDNDVYRKMSNYLEDLSTHYYSETIIDWIKTKVELKSNFFW